MFLDKFIVDNLPFNLDLLPPHSYLVGGAVRDVLLSRKRNYLDLDFVLPNSVIKIAKNIANLYSAGFVILDAKRNIVRVVFPHATIDFAQQEGETIEKDLTRRDFTINAIAYDCFQKKIVDPFNGQKDLKKRIIRMICSENLEDDPLRLLRGYRQACQLDFTIKSETRQTIITLTPLLNNVAKERINTELNYVKNLNSGLICYYKSMINLELAEKCFKMENFVTLYRPNGVGDQKFMAVNFGEARERKNIKINRLNPNLYIHNRNIENKYAIAKHYWSSKYSLRKIYAYYKDVNRVYNHIK